MTASEIHRCPHFGECGGCVWLDRPYEDQLSAKSAALRAELAKFPELVGVAPAPIVAAPHPHFYRNRLLYPLARREGHVIGGFFKRGTHDLVDVRSCEIQDPAITTIAARLRSEVARQKIAIRPLAGVESEAQTQVSSAAAGATAPSAAARALVVRLAHGTGEIAVAIVTTAGLFPEGAAFARAARASGEGLASAAGRSVHVVSIIRNINDGESNVVLGKRSLPLLGPDSIEERFLGFRFRLGISSFFQPNGMAARAAAEAIAAFVGKEAGRVVDAYAGVGILASCVARGAREVIAIEESESAVRDGAANAQRNGLANIRFVRGRVEESLAEAARGGPVDVLLLDPPRAGLTPEARAAVIAASPSRIAYLSCSAATLARDLAELTRTHTIERVVPHDFLPQTEHLEVLALLRRKDA